MTEQNRNGDSDFSDFSFEQALGRLDETVQALETGGLDLADATRVFEDGMKLARICNDMLAATQLRVSRIQTAYGEQMRMLGEEEEVGQED